MKRVASFCVLALLLTTIPSASAQDAELAGIPKIVYVSIDYDAETYTLWAINPDGTSPTPLAVGGQFWSPAISPDGRELAFIARKLPAGTPGIYVMGMDGSDLRVVTPPPSPVRVRPESVVWLPDGRLLYTGLDSGNGAFFFTFEVDGDEQTRIRFPDLYDERRAHPAATVSPDGLRIAVLGANPDLNDFTGYGLLYTVNIDGSDPVPYPAQTAEGNSFSTLSWSPDGVRVVLSSIFDEPPGPIVVANADGSDMRAVSGSIGGVGSPSWSPDGDQIVFIGVDQSVAWLPGGELYVVDADGADLRSLNIEAEVAHRTGTSWGLIPDDVALPAAPVDIADAAR